LPQIDKIKRATIGFSQKLEEELIEAFLNGKFQLGQSKTCRLPLDLEGGT
jgi:hypothetical protein